MVKDMNSKCITLAKSIFSKSTAARYKVLGLFIVFLTPLSTFANGLGESVPYRFDQKDRLRMMEMQLLKESGFYDAQGGGGFGSGGGDTIINGDQINCMVQSSSMANSNAAGMDAMTGSLSGVSDTNLGADANANNSEARGGSDGSLDIGQDNNGNQDAVVSDSNVNSSVEQFDGGGTSDQTIDSYQTSEGATLTSTIDDVTVCDGMTIN